jgi:hypothetical protein
MKLNVAGKMRSSIMLCLFALIGQNRNMTEIANITSTLTQLLAPLVTIIVLIALPILVFNVLTKTVLGKI